MKKIVFFIGSMGSGGAERVISHLANDYVQRGYDTHICMLLKNEVEYDLNPSIYVHDMSGGGGSRIKRVPYWIKSINCFIRSHNPDRIVSFAARINILVLLASFGYSKRVIVSERNDPQLDGRGFVANILTKVLYKFAKIVVFQTEEVKRLFPEYIQRNSRVIPNPIEVKFLYSGKQTNKIVTVGSLKEQKNHEMLIDAFKIIHNIYPDFHLYIYGEGHLRAKLTKQIEREGLHDNVHLPGKKRNVHKFIKDALFFVLSSNYEGLSNALLEAMAMGMPCISTDCTGVDEYIVNNNNGLIVKRGDVNLLASAMLRFIEDDELRINCGRNAKKILKKVNKEKVLKKWAKVID